MILTAEASIHTGCQFHLKRGEFILLTAEADGAGGVIMTFAPLSGEGNNVVTEVTEEGLETQLWNLTQCNNTVQHYPQV